MNRPPKAKSIERLKKALDEIHELKQRPSVAQHFKKWLRNTENAIAYTFGEEGRHVEDFKRIFYGPRIVVGKNPYSKYQQIYEKGLESAASMLESMIDEIEEYWEEDRKQVQTLLNIQRDELINTTKVFVVHGRDLGTRDSVARFLETLKLQPVILDEQADRGQTIIEKFEQHAQEVRFAVVLLTPDDEGRIRGEKSDLKPRARQNVIFELGYFARSFGRNRVCALTKGGVEIPSDYDGVVYIPLDDSGGWKMRLIRELKAAEFDVDANLAY